MEWLGLRRRFEAGRALMWTGLVLLVLAGCFGLREWIASRPFQHATGTITEMEARQDAQGNVAYFPHFRFRLPDDQLIQIVSAKGVDLSTFSDRERVRLAYRAGDPQGAVIAPLASVYAVAMWLGITGTVLFDLGAVLWVRRRQRAMRETRRIA
ncbi:MAG TPA: DUF3592 domain-containing protein [Acidobacteriaceae bacterium]|jgi:hypothetical protein|nr:DUF3592 domain-containing protein [Acidobacteriaceae bacterium]